MKILLYVLFLFFITILCIQCGNRVSDGKEKGIPKEITKANRIVLPRDIEADTSEKKLSDEYKLEYAIIADSDFTNQKRGVFDSYHHEEIDSPYSLDEKELVLLKKGDSSFVRIKDTILTIKTLKGDIHYSSDKSESDNPYGVSHDYMGRLGNTDYIIVHEILGELTYNNDMINLKDKSVEVGWTYWAFSESRKWLMTYQDFPFQGLSTGLRLFSLDQGKLTEIFDKFIDNYGIVDCKWIDEKSLCTKVYKEKGDILYFRVKIIGRGF